ncbi:hypothetical protein QBC46DRAFT_121591 [Diplogelasinospora grovesii]|uniref:Uncharacterized protein n=1 Tax=Diplogelasinospora grovesii TaxID=303347 RepID=A0AAN6S5I7_9PEZI|nr:hypothetical protein QBC46DRAFT_121591 [Diplogelasinospora grovesii]
MDPACKDVSKTCSSTTEIVAFTSACKFADIHMTTPLFPESHKTEAPSGPVPIAFKEEPDPNGARALIIASPRFESTGETLKPSNPPHPHPHQHNAPSELEPLTTQNKINIIAVIEQEDAQATLTRTLEDPEDLTLRAKDIYPFPGLPLKSSPQPLQRSGLRTQIHVNQFAKIKDRTVGDRETESSYERSRVHMRNFPPTETLDGYCEFKEYAEYRFPIFVRKGFDLDKFDEMMNVYVEDNDALEEVIKAEQKERQHLYQTADGKTRRVKEIEREQQLLIMASKKNPGRQPTLSQAHHHQSLEEEKYNINRELAMIGRELSARAIQGGKIVEKALWWDMDPVGATAFHAEEERKRVAVQRDIPRLLSLQHQAPPEGDPQSDDRMPFPYGPLQCNTLAPAADTITVPAWFGIWEKKKGIKAGVAGEKARFQKLMAVVHDLYAKMKKEEEGGAPQEPESEEKKVWSKEWHEPNKHWPYEKWRKRGGWWACRSGPEASPAERACRVCQPAKRRIAHAKDGVATGSAKNIYDTCMAEIDAAVAEAMKAEKEALRKRIWLQHEEADRRINH